MLVVLGGYIQIITTDFQPSPHTNDRRTRKMVGIIPSHTDTHASTSLTNLDIQKVI